MLTWKTKAVLSEDGKTYRLQVKKCGFQMQVSVAYSSFLHVLVMIKYYGFIVENDPSNTMNEEEQTRN
jgi:hypothetical protein